MSLVTRAYFLVWKLTWVAVKVGKRLVLNIGLEVISVMSVKPAAGKEYLKPLCSQETVLTVLR